MYADTTTTDRTVANELNAIEAELATTMAGTVKRLTALVDSQPANSEPPQIEYPRQAMAWLNGVLAQVEANRRIRARHVAEYERTEFPRVNESSFRRY